MRLLLSSFMMLSFVLLSGCFTKTVIEYRPYKEYVVLDDYDLRECPLPPPPNKEEYIKADKEERIKMWVEHYLDSTSATYLRNVQLKHTRAQNDLYRQEVD